MLNMSLSGHGTALPSLRCSKIRHACGHCGHAAGPAGAQVRGLMTHLCHKPGGGGGRDFAVQQPIWCPHRCYSAA
jgi:hypothetical protein